LISTERQIRRVSRLARGLGATSSSTCCPGINEATRACGTMYNARRRSSPCYSQRGGRLFGGLAWRVHARAAQRSRRQPERARSAVGWMDGWMERMGWNGPKGRRACAAVRLASRRAALPRALPPSLLARPAARGRPAAPTRKGWGGNGIPNPHGRFPTGAPERLLLNAVVSEGNVGADAHGRRPNWA